MDEQSDENVLEGDGWISAAKALELVKTYLPNYPKQAAKELVKAVSATLIRTKARRFVKGENERDNIDLPTEFWRAVEHTALDQNWDIGSFEAWGRDVDPMGLKRNRSENWKAFGVIFNRGDVEGIFGTKKSTKSKPPLPERKLKEWWKSVQSFEKNWTKDELVNHAIATFPNHQVSRDRVREIIGPRKTGPKGPRGEVSAE